MHKRLAAWLIFLGILAGLNLAAFSGSGRVVDTGIRDAVWTFCFVLTLIFIWRYLGAQPDERRRLIDRRGLDSLPRSVLRWLFDL